MSIWRPHTTGILIGGLVAILLALVISFMATHFQPTTQVKLGSGAFSTRVASTEAAREKGLSGVEKLSPSEGLLMVFETDDKYAIWMKDMKIPIDILWLDKDKKVIFMVMDAQPEPDAANLKSYVPLSPARYVVELQSGAIKKAGIIIGSRAEFEVEGETK